MLPRCPISRVFTIAASLVFGLTVLFSASSAYAQPSGGDIGLGGQVGEPTGVSLKVYQPGSVSYDFLAAFDLEDFFFLNVHGIFQRQLGDPDNLYLFYGPGGFVGIHDRPWNKDDDVALGISGRIGLSLFIEEFEIYGQLTPRIEVAPRTNGEVGGGVGFRYYF